MFTPSESIPCEHDEREGRLAMDGIPRIKHLESFMPEKRRILVVDDEDALRTVLSGELVSEGYDVRTAADGEEAVASLQKEAFDLILLDIKMPRMNGFEVLKFVKEKFPKTKVVMLTGFADLKNAIESKKLGAEDFVSKPYDLVDLLTTIERVLGE
jgi:DNA-binding NtrC family response regulator